MAVSVNQFFNNVPGQPIAVIEAMKMETNIISTIDGHIDKIYVKQGEQIVSGQLIAKLVKETLEDGEVV